MPRHYLRILAAIMAIALGSVTTGAATAKPAYRVTASPLSCLASPEEFKTLESLYESCFSEAVNRIRTRKDTVKDGNVLRTTTLVNGQPFAVVQFCSDWPCAVFVQNPNGREYLMIKGPRPPVNVLWILSGSLQWFGSGRYFEQQWATYMAMTEPMVEEYKMFKTLGQWLKK